MDFHCGFNSCRCRSFHPFIADIPTLLHSIALLHFEIDLGGALNMYITFSAKFRTPWANIGTNFGPGPGIRAQFGPEPMHRVSGPKPCIGSRVIGS